MAIFARARFDIMERIDRGDIWPRRHWRARRSQRQEARGIIDRIKGWLGRGRDESDIEAILAHNARIKREGRERAEAHEDQAREALASISDGDLTDDRDKRANNGGS